MDDRHAVPRSRGAEGDSGRVEGKDVKLDDDDDDDWVNTADSCHWCLLTPHLLFVCDGCSMSSTTTGTVLDITIGTPLPPLWWW